jgi:hypothetical protein
MYGLFTDLYENCKNPSKPSRESDHFTSLAREDWKLIGNTTLLLNHSINRGGYL